MALDATVLKDLIITRLQDAFTDLVFPDSTDAAWDAIASSIVDHVRQGMSGFLNVQTFTGNGTYTPTPGTTKVRVRGVAGGGGGGGAGGAAAQGAAGGGGAPGAYIDLWIDPGVAITGGSVTIGGAGSGGTNTGGNGAAGGDTVFTIAGTTYTLKGGGGGTGMPSGTTVDWAYPGQPVAGSSSGAVVGGGWPGMRIVTVGGPAGAGGSNPLGQGGPAPASIAGKNNASGFGAGGSGAQGSNGTANTGGNGTAGVLIIEEYGA